MRGCVFAERFESALAVAANDGTVIGALAYQDGGAYFDGVNDGISYACGCIGNKASLSIQFDFIPGFLVGDGAAHCFLDTDSGYYRIIKTAADTLAITLGNTLVATIAAVDLAAAWRAGGRNCLVVSSTTTVNTTNVTLNGTKLLTNGGAAWTVAAVTTMYIGQDNAAGSRFSGTMQVAKAWGAALTDAEALAYWDRSMFNYEQRAVLNMTTLMESHDPTSMRALDRSGKAHHGAFSATPPTKIAGSGGYIFVSASSTYLNCGDSDDFSFCDGAGNDSPFSFFTQIVPVTLANAARVISKGPAAAGGEWNLRMSSSGAVYVNMIDADGDTIGRGATGVVLGVGRVASLGFTYSGSKTNAGVGIYLDAVRVDNADDAAGVYGGMSNTATPLHIGSTSSPGNYLNSKLYWVLVFPFALNQTQVNDLHIAMLASMNMV
jgi:hypothetical protein